MANESFTHGLSGEEIINDVLTFKSKNGPSEGTAISVQQTTTVRATAASSRLT